MTQHEHRAARPETRTTDPAYVGLLKQVMTNTLDEDYQAVADRRGSAGRPNTTKTRVGLMVVLALFGVMVGISALQTQQDRPRATAERAALILQINQRQARYDDLRDTMSGVSQQVTRLQSAVAAEVDGNSALGSRIATLGIEAGTRAAAGPGIVITVDDAADTSATVGGTILDTDLRQLVNALWQSGAEAIAIDGHRLSTLSSIRFAGQAITVDYRSLTPPYVVSVIGDPDTLPARLLETDGGRMWQGLEANFGITFALTTAERVTVPADPRDRLVYARPEKAR
ncbi:MAG: DUF881 domain-containing protein [Nocardioidaceae bacterium]